MGREIKDKELTPEYYYDQITPEIEKTFTHEQRAEVKTLLKRAIRKPSKKLIEARFTFWFIKRLYCVIFIGVDRRRGRRSLDQDTYRNRFIITLVRVLFYILEFAVIVAIVFLFLYFFKSAMGIDVMPDQHLEDIIDSNK